MNISASNIIKNSAMKICFFNHNTFKKINQKSNRMLEGVKFQNKKSSSKYKEMCGCYNVNNLINIYFSIDEIIKKEKVLILKEYKNYDKKSEDWFLNYAIIQTALYHSLALKVRYFKTAEFYKKQGNKQYEIYVNKNIKSILEIGNRKFHIIVKNSNKIINYYVDKINASLNYKNAKEWDNLHKFKDWDYLKEFIIVKKLK